MNLQNQLVNFISHTSNTKSTKKKRQNLIKSLNFNKENNDKHFHYNESCLICCEYPKDTKVITPCRHLFCHACLSRWMETNKNCPVCKKSFE